MPGFGKTPFPLRYIVVPTYTKHSTSSVYLSISHNVLLYTFSLQVPRIVSDATIE